MIIKILLIILLIKNLVKNQKKKYKKKEKNYKVKKLCRHVVLSTIFYLKNFQ